MPNIFEKLKLGQTDWQIKKRNKRFAKRRGQMGQLHEQYASRFFQYDSLDDMLQAFRSEGPPIVIRWPVLNIYLSDWRRKQSHGGIQEWMVLCNPEWVVDLVTWSMTDSNNGKVVQGGKIYDMTVRTTEEAVNDLMDDLNI